MATILVISFSDLKRDPRVHRQIEALRVEHAVLAAGFGDPGLVGVRFIGCKRSPRRLSKKLTEAFDLFLHRYNTYYWKQSHVAQLDRELKDTHFDLAIANDIEALPIGLKLAKGRPVILDAHEYSPLEFENEMIWRILFAPYKDMLCRVFMPRAAMVTTVCQGIADRYAQKYGIRVEVITNATTFHALSPRPTGGERVRMVHHGAALAGRRLDAMIDLMELLDKRFSLDFVLVPGKPECIEWLKCRARGRPNIRFLDAVPMDQLVTFSSQYDIGVFLLPPTNFNYRMALPNKVFEFIQARLAIAIGPSPEMARLVQEFGCGVVAEDFSPESLARALRSLTAEDIDRMKAGSDRAARIHTAEHNAEKLRGSVVSLLTETRL